MIDILSYDFIQLKDGYMKTTFALLCGMMLFLHITGLDSQTFDADSFISAPMPNKLPALLKKSAQTFTIDATSAEKVFGSYAQSFTLNNFPVSLDAKKTIQLKVVPSSIDAKTVIMVGNKQVPIPHIISYEGFVQSDEGSRVFMTYASGELYGWVASSTGSNITFLPETTDSYTKKDHMLYSESALSAQLQIPAKLCGTNEVSHTGIKTWEVEASLAKGERKLDNRLLEMQVIMETTTSYFTKVASRNETRAMNLLIAMTNATNALYRRELNLNIVIPYIQIWTEDTPDPYTKDGGDTPALLQEVQTRWGKITNRTRDIVHCLDAMGSSSAGAGIVAGIANGIGALCNSAISNAYSVTGISSFANLPVTTYMKDVSTMAHELGHNMGSYHTHNCDQWKPAVDSCLSSGAAYQNNIAYSSETCNTGAPKPVPGSIMSYCDLTNPSKSVPFTFLPRVFTFLRNRLENSKCITEALEPQIRVIGPWGNQTFISGKSVPIEWTSTRINSVNIQFSTDGGGSWSNIASGIPAVSTNTINGQGMYMWSVPRISTNSGRFRIVDMANAAINDTSWANFRIVQPSLALSTNMDGKAFGQSESLQFQWTKTNVDTVLFMFSSNNGSTWETISRPTGTVFNFQMPDISAQQCWVRIADATDMSLISQTGPFSIGKEEITLLNPKGGEKLCANKRFVIAWTYKNIANSKLLVQYANGNSAWQNISTASGIDPWVSVIGFNPPSLQTDSLRIRVVSRVDSTIFSVSNPIQLSNEAGCIATSIDEVPDLPILMIAPNPITGTTCTMTINAIHQCLNAQLTLTNLTGSVVHEFGREYSFTEGSHSLSLQVPIIASGRYFLTLRCNGKSTSIPVTIER